MAQLQFVVALAGALVAAPENPNPWEEIEKDGGITVWRREVPGSNIREVKATMEIDVGAERVWQVLIDVDRYVEFMPYVLEARTLESEGANVEYQYQLIDPPLVDKRDYVLRVEKSIDEARGLFVRKWSAVKNKGPAKPDDAVRLSVVDGMWQLEKLGGSKVRVTYYLFTDPGGSIPNWIANKANRTSVPELMDAVRKRAKNPSYKRG